MFADGHDVISAEGRSGRFPFVKRIAALRLRPSQSDFTTPRQLHSTELHYACVSAGHDLCTPCACVLHRPLTMRPPPLHTHTLFLCHCAPSPPFPARESLVPAPHAATFSAVCRTHGPCWYHEWCDPEEDGDRGQERAGAPAILRACGVQACAIGHSCSGAPSMRSHRGR